MSQAVYHPHPHAVKHNRFVAPTEFEQGRLAYRTGKRRSVCVSDEMRDGWDVAAGKGADAYWLGMMQEAN